MCLSRVLCISFSGSAWWLLWVFLSTGEGSAGALTATASAGGSVSKGLGHGEKGNFAVILEQPHVLKTPSSLESRFFSGGTCFRPVPGLRSATGLSLRSPPGCRTPAQDQPPSCNF